MNLARTRIPSIVIVAGQTITQSNVLQKIITVNPVTTPTNVATQTITGTMKTGATVTLSGTATFGAVTYPTTTTVFRINYNAELPALIFLKNLNNMTGFFYFLQN